MGREASEAKQWAKFAEDRESAHPGTCTGSCVARATQEGAPRGYCTERTKSDPVTPRRKAYAAEDLLDEAWRKRG